MKTHNTLLGFESISDLIQTTFNFRYKLEIAFPAILVGISSFITEYIYNDAKAIYFLLFIMAVDFITALYRSYKTKTFTSSRFPRIFIVMLAYCLLLSLSWNAAIYAPIFSFLPGTLYTAFIGTNLISISENLMQARLIQSNIVDIVKDYVQTKIKRKNEKQDL